jgi:hypothetical protein
MCVDYASASPEDSLTILAETSPMRINLVARSRADFEQTLHG